MSIHFENELDALKQKLLAMASHAEAAVARSVQALMERNDDLARRVKDDDDILDGFEIEIDDLAISLLSKAPLASELRFITVAMKISHDLERVGDEATTISRRVLALNQEPQLKQYVAIPTMAQLGLVMLKDALDAFVRRDTAQARDIIPRDKPVDRLNKEVHSTLSGFMTGQPDTISRCLNLMVISKSLERIADHAKGIAEEVVYLCEAEDIRHGKGQALMTDAQRPGGEQMP
jgi:phosphate transport system protein